MRDRFCTIFANRKRGTGLKIHTVRIIVERSGLWDRASTRSYAYRTNVSMQLRTGHELIEPALESDYHIAGQKLECR